MGGGRFGAMLRQASFFLRGQDSSVLPPEGKFAFLVKQITTRIGDATIAAFPTFSRNEIQCNQTGPPPCRSTDFAGDEDAWLGCRPFPTAILQFR